MTSSGQEGVVSALGDDRAGRPHTASWLLEPFPEREATGEAPEKPPAS